MTSPTASYVVPALDEEGYVGDCLASIYGMETAESYEVLVVDGGSIDSTREIARRHGAEVVEQEGEGIGDARDLGAEHADGDWLAFVDADTRVDASYLSAMLGFAEWHDLSAASSRCRIPGVRSLPMELAINHVFPRLDRPVLPGFNFFVDAAVYEETGGFPNVANEDTAYSRQLGREYSTGYCRRVLVETSPRRIRDQGLLGMTAHYLWLDWKRLRAKY